MREGEPDQPCAESARAGRLAFNRADPLCGYDACALAVERLPQVGQLLTQAGQALFQQRDPGINRRRCLGRDLRHTLLDVRGVGSVAIRALAVATVPGPIAVVTPLGPAMMPIVEVLRTALVVRTPGGKVVTMPMVSVMSMLTMLTVVGKLFMVTAAAVRPPAGKAFGPVMERGGAEVAVMAGTSRTATGEMTSPGVPSPGARTAMKPGVEKAVTSPRTAVREMAAVARTHCPGHPTPSGRVGTAEAAAGNRRTVMATVGRLTVAMSTMVAVPSLLVAARLTAVGTLLVMPLAVFAGFAAVFPIAVFLCLGRLVIGRLVFGKAGKSKRAAAD